MKKKKFGILQNDVVKEGKNGVKYRKAILVAYEMIDIVDAMTIFVAQPTQDIRVKYFACKNDANLILKIFYRTWQVHTFAMSALKGEVYNVTFVIDVEEIAWLFNLIAANSQVYLS